MPSPSLSTYVALDFLKIELTGNPSSDTFGLLRFGVLVERRRILDHPGMLWLSLRRLGWNGWGDPFF